MCLSPGSVACWLFDFKSLSLWVSGFPALRVGVTALLASEDRGGEPGEGWVTVGVTDRVMVGVRVTGSWLGVGVMVRVMVGVRVTVRVKVRGQGHGRAMGSRGRGYGHGHSHGSGSRCPPRWSSRSAVRSWLLTYVVCDSWTVSGTIENPGRGRGVKQAPPACPCVEERPPRCLARGMGTGTLVSWLQP